MRIEEGGRQIPPPPPPPPPPHDNYTSADAAERHALAASAPAPAPAPPPPSAQARATDKEVGEARAAQKEVDSLRSPQAKASIPPRLRAQELREAQEVAQQQWRDVPPAIRTELAAAGNDAKDPADANQRRAAVADEATRIRTRLGEDPRLVPARGSATAERHSSAPKPGRWVEARVDRRKVGQVRMPVGAGPTWRGPVRARQARPGADRRRCPANGCQAAADAAPGPPPSDPRHRPAVNRSRCGPGCRGRRSGKR